MSKEAAQHLINLKTRLGKSVPAYAKEIVAGQRESGERVNTELYSALAQMRNTKRDAIFKEDAALAKWYKDFAANNPNNMAVAVRKLADANEVDNWYQSQAR